MYRILGLLLFLSLQSCLYASELVRYPHQQGSFQAKRQWALQTASEHRTFWVGYSIPRFMDAHSEFMSGVSINGNWRNKGRSLQEWIYGTKPATAPNTVRDAARVELGRTDKSRVKVWKEIGIFHRFQRGAKIPDKSQILTLTMSVSFDAPLYWLEKISYEESFQYLTGLYSQIPDREGKEDLMSAIGVHPPQLAFPFLKKILLSNEPEEAQEAAAIFMGDLETPEALQFLQQVTEKNPHENVREAAVVGISEMRTDAALQVVSQIAKSHQDSELRETAIAMLADKQGGQATKILEEIAWFDSDEDIRQTAVVMLGESDAGVPALLKIMEEHPSEDTREVAVHTLAETVAGRKILKEKIKQ
jgi:hypothetical protein